MPIRPRALLLSAVVLVAACSVGGGTTTGPSVSSIPSVSVTATRVEVNLTDALKIEPAKMTVPAGVPVTFVVTNSGATDHEFYLGDEPAQAEHEKEMACRFRRLTIALADGGPWLAFVDARATPIGWRGR